MHPTHPRLRCSPMLVTLVVAVAMSAVGCKNGISIPTTATIGSKGGTLHDAACGLTLQIPAGALTSDTLFVVTESDGGAPLSSGRALASVTCTVTPPALFATAANVTMTFDASRVPPDSTASDADLRLTEGGSTQLRLQGNSVAVATSTVTATTPGTGGFFVTVPATPAANSVTLNPSGGVALTVGQTQQYSAQVFDAAGTMAYDQTVTWSTTSVSIATIDPTGLLTAVGAGHAQVLATAGLVAATADGGQVSGAADVYVISSTPSPSGFGWENPLPQGNDIHGLSIADGALILAANNGTVMIAESDGGFGQALSSPGLSLAGAVFGGGQLGTAGTVDEVVQGIEHLSGVAINLTTSGPVAQVFSTSVLGAVALYGDDQGVIAVGSGNDAYLLEPGSADGGWIALDTPVSEALLSVGPDPTSGRRVVGARGQVYREDHESWFPIWDQPLETLFSYTTSIGHSAYATDEGLVLHQFAEGTGWSDDQTPPGIALDHIDLLSTLGPALAFSAVDTTLTPHLWVRPAATWTEISGLAGTDELFAATSEPDGGGFVGGTAGALYAVNGGQLTDLRTGSIEDLVGLSVAPDGSAFGVTAGACLDAACIEQNGHFLVRDASGSWQAMSPQPSTGYAFRAVAARAANDVLVVGDAAKVFHWDGTALFPVTAPTGATSLLAAQVCGSDIWVGGQPGLLAKYVGASAGFSVQALPGAGDLYAFACTSATDVWAAGQYALYHFDGLTWTAVDIGSASSGPWRSIMVDANEVWVGGAADFLLHSPDRLNWEVVQNIAGLSLHAANGMWESAPGDGYLVGSTQSPRQALLLRWDGALWTPLDPGTDHELLSIGGVPGLPPTRQVWVGGRDGSLLHSLP